MCFSIKDFTLSNISLEVRQSLLQNEENMKFILKDKTQV